MVKAFYGEREVVLESPADSAEEPELRPASSQAFRDQDLEDAGVAVAAQFFDGSMTCPCARRPNWPAICSTAVSCGSAP